MQIYKEIMMRRFILALLLVGVLITSVFANQGEFVNEQNRIIFTDKQQVVQETFAISSIHWRSASDDEIGGSSAFVLTGNDYVRIAECQATALTDYCDFVFPEPVITHGMHVPVMDGNLFIYGKRR